MEVRRVIRFVAVAVLGHNPFVEQQHSVAGGFPKNGAIAEGRFGEKRFGPLALVRDK